MQALKKAFPLFLLLIGSSENLNAGCCSSRCTLPKKNRSVQRRPDKPHINVPAGVPGISSLFALRPEAAKPMRELAEVLLRESKGLSRGERELMAAYVSSLNECNFCCNCHSAAAVHQLDDGAALVQAVKKDYTTAPISEKLKALLAIAGKVQRDARLVSPEDIERAHANGATDLEIHDTVLIAAAFCMYNRYVDGLASYTPTDPKVYNAIGKQLAEHGYIRERENKQ